MELKDSEHVYSPREDSKLLQRVVEEYMKKFKPNRVLDMGTGSGIQAIVAKKSYADSEVSGADINPMAIDLANENAKLNSVAIKFFVSDLFERFQDQKFDLIIFNAPYLPPEPPLDPIWSGGEQFIMKFIKLAREHLNPNGKILFVYSSKSPVKFKHKIVAETKVFFETLYVAEA
ncbi:MAG: protoporphyrinogen oxidase [uncultured DHVE6 group euryarchaeote]|jgi:release factor glutamine methyltransferase|nr:MAG: protoporphyrinogen oxidase [uncultured DHVE6 group euryarchaeote]